MDQGALLVLITKYCGLYTKGPPVAEAIGRARLANVSEILAHMVLGDRVSECTTEQFRAAGQQQGFVDISGRRRVRSEVEAGDQDE